MASGMDMTLFRAEQRAAFATRSLLAHAAVPPLTIVDPPFTDLNIYESWVVPRGQVLQAGRDIHVHPSTYMAITGRTLYTRHMLGSLEAERDKRRAAKWYT